jgi:carbon storage regulator
MLILRRKKNESILINDDIRITVVECAADGVRIAIDAPKQVSILREELSKAETENKQSIAPGYHAVASLQNSLLGSIRGKSAETKRAEE